MTSIIPKNKKRQTKARENNRSLVTIYLNTFVIVYYQIYKNLVTSILWFLINIYFQSFLHLKIP